MKKAYNIIVALAVAAAAWATPPKAVDEDFEGSQFPPPGWTQSGSGSGSWSWTNPGGYARGYASAGFTQNVTTSLFSPTFHVNRGTRLRVEFRYRTDGFTEVSRKVVVAGWQKSVGYKQSWTKFDEFTTPTAAGGDYKFEFRLYITSGGSHGYHGIWEIDDVLITRDNVDVAPTSIGRVKALYY
jgi:hypothetical protein